MTDEEDDRLDDRWQRFGAGAVAADGGTIPEGHSYCHVHHVPERVGRRAFRVCFECGHVWTRRSLRRAVRRYYLRPDPWATRAWLRGDEWTESWAQAIWRALTVRSAGISFCQVCVHDF